MAFRDAGERIGLSRKDLAALRARFERPDRALDVDDLAALEDEAPDYMARFLTRDQQLGTRRALVERLRAHGCVPQAAWVAAQIHTAVDPPDGSPDGRRAYVERSCELRGILHDWRTLEDARQSLTELHHDVERWQTLGPRFVTRVRGYRRVMNSARQRTSWDWAELARATGAPPREGRPRWSRRVPDEVERQGGPAGSFAGADALCETFGLRGVEYGHWVDDGAAGHHTQSAGLALLDLADVLGVEPRALSLGGRLALALGARGSGAAAAHYEPARRVVNLTKLRGGGALAHEWGHALDHALVVALTGEEPRRGRSESVLSPGLACDRAGPDVASALIDLRAAILLPAPEPRSTTSIAPGPEFCSSRQLDRRLARAGNDPDAALRDLWTRARAGDRDAPRTPRGLRRIALYFAWRCKRAVALPTEPFDASDFVRTARALGVYWRRPAELLARAFEAYVHDALEAAGRCNTYLVSGCSEEDAQRFGVQSALLEANGGGSTSIHPRGEERRRVHEAFGRLMPALRAADVLARP